MKGIRYKYVAKITSCCMNMLQVQLMGATFKQCSLSLSPLVQHTTEQLRANACCFNDRLTLVWSVLNGSVPAGCSDGGKQTSQ